MNEIIGAHHEFHDEEFVTGWADRFVPTPDRLKLFSVIHSELVSAIPSNGHVIELGIGPGYLADYILRVMSGIRYSGIDFSHPMLGIAQQRLKSYSSQVTYIQADLLKDNWWENISDPADAIVSTWSLHDLGSQEYVKAVYKNCMPLLRDGGIFLNGDFIKPDKASHEFEPGRFEIGEHLDILDGVGFKDVECLIVLEEEIESPTAAQNYACLKATR